MRCRKKCRWCFLQLKTLEFNRVPELSSPDAHVIWVRLGIEHSLRKNLAIVETSKELVKQMKRNIKLWTSLQGTKPQEKEIQSNPGSCPAPGVSQPVEPVRELENWASKHRASSCPAVTLVRNSLSHGGMGLRSKTVPTWGGEKDQHHYKQWFQQKSYKFYPLFIYEHLWIQLLLT